MNRNQFPALADSLQESAARAAKMNLTITHYNSGATGKAASALGNGTRFFHGRKADHFQGNHIYHARSSREVLAFLEGYAAALAQPA